MFLSFLVPLPGTMDGLLVVHYGGTFGESHIMSFPDEKPGFKDDNEVMIGFSEPVTTTGWSFNLVGAGELRSEDADDDPALNFFTDLLAIQARGTEEQQADAAQIITAYIDQTKDFFFQDIDPNLLSGSDLSIEEARDEISRRRSSMH